tara:strand:- start:357 stop:578 length:222 start_codon:yes stop_codon:yes gene_type:complete
MTFTKTNIREVIRRLVKYLVLVLAVAFVTFSLLKNKVTNMDVALIALTGGFIYCLLDIVSPSISLKIDKTCGI